MNTRISEPFVSHWIGIVPRPTEVESLGKFTFAVYVRRYFDQQYPCPPFCMDPSAAGQAITYTMPMATFFVAVAAWFVAEQGDFPLIKVLVATLLGFPVGLIIGYWYAKFFNRVVAGNMMAIDEDQLRQLVREEISGVRE